MLIVDLEIHKSITIIHTSLLDVSRVNLIDIFLYEVCY